MHTVEAGLQLLIIKTIISGKMAVNIYKDELKYRCYHKSNKLCACEGQANCIAARVDEAVCHIFDRIKLGKGYQLTIHMEITSCLKTFLSELD